MNKTELRHLELRDKLIESAETIIVEKGLSGLKSREVTTMAGCSLGALYNVIKDLDTLIMHVNSRTLERMGVYLRGACEGVQQDPEKSMLALADAYIDFAFANRHLWLALFQFRLPEGTQAPDWYQRNHYVLIEQIIGPLGQLFPEFDHKMLYVRAQTNFAAVHGIVIFSMEQGYVAIPTDKLRAEVRAIVSALVQSAQSTGAAQLVD